MTFLEAKNYLAELTSHITFNYKGKLCGIDPLSRTEFDMWYGSEEITVNSIDEVTTVKFFDNCTLFDIWNDIDELEY